MSEDESDVWRERLVVAKAKAEAYRLEAMKLRAALEQIAVRAPGSEAASIATLALVSDSSEEH